LTIHLDEDNWLKGNVIDNDTNIQKILEPSTSDLSKSTNPNTADDTFDFNKRRDK